uniref:Alpha/beta fold hydrolase n=1 Tax=Desulfatirhabdium butyrativorans TaxID=340467 RepID=A0A7C4RNF2_9BACT
MKNGNTGKQDAPVEIDAVQGLKTGGADLIGIASNTLNSLADTMERKAGLPVPWHLFQGDHLEVAGPNNGPLRRNFLHEKLDQKKGRGELMPSTRKYLMITMLFFCCSQAWSDDTLQYLRLGDFQLEQGGVIRDCLLGYRTSGTLNKEKSNAILVPTWLAGTSKELIDLNFIGPGMAFDSTKYFIIAVDAFGNGISSSPSNSEAQPRDAFPVFGIRDLVRAQQVLVSRHLKIPRLRAVAGISMGAMTTLQWMVSYPDLMDMVIAVSGNPRLTSYEMLYWSAQLGVLEQVGACKGSETAMKTLAPLHVLQAWPSDYRNTRTKPEGFPAFLADQQKNLSAYNAADWAAQLKAILLHDVFQGPDIDREQLRKTICARLLVLISPKDQMVLSEETLAFAQLLGARTVELDGTCGHFAFLCDQKRLAQEIHEFLAKG